MDVSGAWDSHHILNSIGRWLQPSSAPKHGWKKDPTYQNGKHMKQPKQCELATQMSLANHGKSPSKRVWVPDARTPALSLFWFLFDMCCPFALSRHWFWCLRQLPRKAILSVGFGGSSSTSTPQVECHAALATPPKSNVFSSDKKSESLGYKT